MAHQPTSAFLDPCCRVPVQASGAVIVKKIGPLRSPTHRSMARAVRGARGMVTILSPLRVIVSVRCPVPLL